MPPAPTSDDLGERLPRSHRVRKRGQFMELQRGGVRFVSGALVLLTLPNQLGWPRLGVTVSTKVGNSVVRSKVKRRLREIFRKHRALLPASSDLVFIARSSAAKSSFEKLLRDFEAVAAQAKRTMASRGVRQPPP